MFADPVEGENHQEVPELMSILKIGVMARGRVEAEAVHRQLRDVFFVDSTVGVDFHFPNRKVNDSLVVPSPDRIDGTIVAGFEFPEPVRDRPDVLILFSSFYGAHFLGGSIENFSRIFSRLVC